MPFSIHAIKAFLRTGIFVAILVLMPGMVCAQSLGIGFGLGLPLMDYYTGQIDREYRVTPEPGYYPVLKNFENAYGSLHLSASLLLDFDLPFGVEIRFDMARMRWRKSHVTHVTCKPVDVVNGTFNDAIADYIALDDVPPECLNRETYRKSEDISGDEMASLWFFHISGGARYNFYENDTWQIFAGAHLGLTIATDMDGQTWFGGNIDALLGFMYRLSETIWIGLDTKLIFMVTQVPQDSQIRINHETQTGGNIFTSLVQPNAYIDFQLTLRFDFSHL